jgi:hypothetical protein
LTWRAIAISARPYQQEADANGKTIPDIFRLRQQAFQKVGLADNAGHVIDTHCEASLLVSK